MKRLSKHSPWARDSAILYINGDILEGHDHIELLNNYLSSNNKMKDFIEDLVVSDSDIANLYDSEQQLLEDIRIADERGSLPKIISLELDDIDREYGFKSSYKLGFACKAHKGIYLETNNVMNVSVEEVASALHKHFNLPVYDDTSCFSSSEDPKDYKLIVSCKRLKRIV